MNVHMWTAGLWAVCFCWTGMAVAQPGKSSREAVIQQVAKDFDLTPEAVQQLPWSRILDEDNWYHRSRVMDWPGFPAEATRTVAPAGEQGDFICTGTDDDLVIQAAIDALPDTGGKVVILPGIYHLGNSIRPKDNTELEVQGTLRVVDAVTSKLTRDVTSGQVTVHVADAGRFRVGQWVTFVDDNPRKNHKGGRKYGDTATITATDGDTLTVNAALGVNYAKSRWRVEDYLVERNAYVTTSHSAILVLGVKRVYIHGGGTIDANRTGQSPTAPLPVDRGGEEQRAGCAVSIVESAWVKVENLTIKGGSLHNVTIHKSQDVEVSGCEIAEVNDKNILVWHANRVRLIGNHLRDAAVEDGICCHATGGPYIFIARNRATNNPRFGIHVGQGSPHPLVVRNVVESCGRPLDVKDNNKGIIAFENTVDGRPADGAPAQP